MRRRPKFLRISVVAPAAVSLFLTGCGGGSSPSAAASTQSQLVAYSHCMRSHGVPNFPDPNSAGEIPKQEIIVLGNGPRVQAAESACQHLMPKDGLGPQGATQQSRTRLADALSFARCMRSHGVSGFPDPTTQGELTVEMVQAQGIDVHSPAVLHAVKECLPASHGLLTVAKVRRALRDAGG